MIDHNLPEPEERFRRCDSCGRPPSKNACMKGKLIHWPSDDWEGDEPNWTGQRPFSIWLYECRFCRASETKRKNYELRRKN